MSASIFRSRFVLASEELATLFKPEGHQSDINDYFSGTSQVSEPVIENVVSSVKVAQITNVEMFGVASDNSTKTNRTEKKKPKLVEQNQTTLF